MWAALDPRVWVAFALAVAVSLGGGYIWGRVDGRNLANADHKVALAQAADDARAKERELDKKFEIKEKEHAAEKATADKKYSDLLGRVRSSSRAPTAPVAGVPECPRPADNPAGEGTRPTETRAELDREFVQRILSRGQEGDDGIRDLNLCIDKYNEVRATINGRNSR